MFHSIRRYSEHRGYRAGNTDRPAGQTNSISILIGAALIAAAILLSTLVSAVGTRYIGVEGPTDETMWLVDRLTGTVYKCQASERGKASCEADIATGSIGHQPR